jgi:NADH:ubiquinone oxidoreductase subunit 6 (subunit J)
MELQAFLFWILALATSACAVAVVVTQNIVRSATWLLFTLAGTAGIFFLLGADFVGATQLLVYVGGTLVLVVFGVMLTAQGPLVNLRTNPVEWAGATILGMLLLGVLAVTVWNWEAAPPSTPYPNAPADSMNSAVLGEALLGIRAATPEAELTGVRVSGRPPQRHQVAYLLPFEIASVHLVVVLIGAAYLARAKRRRSGGAT